MNTNLAPKLPWGKRYRAPLMNAAFWLFWIGFALAYMGWTRNNQTLIILAFAVFCAACIIPLVTKK
jgi:CHASE2 domain-containing sensor protein